MSFTSKDESALPVAQEIPVTLTRRNLLRSLSAVPLFGAAKAWAQQTESFAALAPSAGPKLDFQGKLSTHTGIIAEKREAAMVSSGSLDAMQSAIGLYEEAVAGGGWEKLPAGKFEKGVKAPRVVNLRERLVRENYLDMEALSVEAPEVYDGHLVGAVRAFQINHGIAPTGGIGPRTRAEMDVSARQRLFTLYENMPRVEAHIAEIRERAILVNIPSLQLETVQNGIVYARHNVVVGKLDRPSPTLNSVVTDVTFNPYWNAPASIVAKDIIPKYLKDPEYLYQMDIRVFDGVGGPEIDPAEIDWANTPPERYHFQQQPGEHNALATVKVNFANTHMVYLHDTPHRELFEQNDRYQSSGCVRVDQVRMFINWILAGQDGFGEADFEMIAASQENTVMPVNEPPSVHLMYLTAWATEDGRINFRPDAYRLDGKGFTLGQPEPLENI
jgi:L,D-transpeptidase YcbB